MKKTLAWSLDEPARILVSTQTIPSDDDFGEFLAFALNNRMRYDRVLVDIGQFTISDRQRRAFHEAVRKISHNRRIRVAALSNQAPYVRAILGLMRIMNPNYNFRLFGENEISNALLWLGIPPDDSMPILRELAQLRMQIRGGGTP